MPLPPRNSSKPFALFFDFRRTMTEEQEEFVNSIIDNPVTICNARAGTGKTLMSLLAARYLIEVEIDSGINSAYYIFSPVQESAMGHRPGSQLEKEQAYHLPVIDAIVEMGYQPEQLERPDFWLKVESDTFLRGTNKQNAVVIIDEAQNFTVDQLKKVISRVHDTCRLVVIGHTGQIDLKNKEKSGFKRVIEVFEPHKDKVKVCNLTKNFRGWISTMADEL